MESKLDICSLDYLMGTLSTAYRGNITSLVAKDFCMNGEGDVITLKGTVIAMPPGDYEATLIQGGGELARTTLALGSFELKTDKERMLQAQDLQIDIIQNGRHIGTFLLKRKSANGYYISAVELSEELRGVDFKRLTAPLRDKIGLLGKAEDIIAAILSPKKDWGGFSDRLNGFMADIFWSARTAFYDSFEMLVRFSLKAAERGGTVGMSKPISNFLDSIELPLEHEEDDERLRIAIDIWLGRLKGSAIDLSLQLRKASRILASIHDRFPDAEIGHALAHILGALRNRLIAMPTMNSSILESLEGRVDRDEYMDLADYGDARRKELLHMLDRAGSNLEQRAYGDALATLGGFNPDLMDDERMITAFYDAAVRHISAESADAFTAAIADLLSLLPVLSSRALLKVQSNAPQVVEKLASYGKIDDCRMLLGKIDQAASPMKEEIVMNQGLANAILHSHDDGIIALYRDIVKEIMIPAAKVSGFSKDTWGEIVNPLHLKRLTQFMEIMQTGGETLRDVLIHVIANLYAGGVHIPDDRLFQRQVSAYLNSEAMKLPFLLNHLLLKKLPVYFNDVGAVSRIRDYSTEVDSWGNDPVLYFLRKQVHVNASNYNIRLIEEIIRSWVEGDPSLLKNVVPPDVLGSLKLALFERYSAVIKPFFEVVGVLDVQGLHIRKLLDVPERMINEYLRVDGRIDEIRTKIMLTCRLYQELVKKYSLLYREFESKDPIRKLPEHIEGMQSLKRTILAPEKTVAQESLYFKRHIAFGIPSVLGSYHEPKFDAFGDMLRREAQLGVLFEEVIAGLEDEKKHIARKDLSRWLSCLSNIHELLKLEGIENVRVDAFEAILKNGWLRLSQIVDLLRMWQKELAWIVEFFTRTFHQPLMSVLAWYPKDELPEYFMNLDPGDRGFLDKAADIIIRNMISDVTGLVEADGFIHKLARSLVSRVGDDFDEELNAREWDVLRSFSVIQELTDAEAMRLAPFIGGKAENLVYLSNRGFRVPIGVVLPSVHTHHYKEYTESPDFLSLLKQAVKNIEKKSGALFGDRDNPLFLSVRSGSYVSMPGILSTILYCGMNRDTVRAFMKNTGDPRLAWDSYRRFIEHYATVVLGLEQGIFGNIMDTLMAKCGVAAREELSPGQLKDIVGLYERELSRRGKDIPDEVYEQLRRSVRAVYASWFSKRAEQFRQVTGTSARWGTAVTLMQMIIGNAAGGGASVFFTRNPFTHEQEAYGETRENATGEDLVYGRRSNRPLSRGQIGTGRKSLEDIDPGLYYQHRELAKSIEGAMGALPQEVEVAYTKEAGGERVIFVLQTRRMEAGEDFPRKFDEICRMESRIIGRGIAVYGGALSGIASFASSPERIEELKKTTDLPVILLRKTANTDDVSLMPAIGGIITSAGGITSHAAVLARKFHVTAVVSCSNMHIETRRGESYATIGGIEVKEGDAVSIDGSTGLVFSGFCT